MNLTSTTTLPPIVTPQSASFSMNAGAMQNAQTPPSSTAAQPQSQNPLDINEPQLFRMISRWLGDRDRQLIQVQIRGNRPQAQSNLEPSSRGPSASGSPNVAEKKTEKTSICGVCNTRKANTLCANISCKSCCVTNGQWACSVHKSASNVTKPSKPLSSENQEPSSRDNNAENAVSPAVSVKNLLSGVAGLNMPCAFCGKDISFQIAFLRQHLHTCKPSFFTQAPGLENLNIQQLYELSWSFGQPGKPLPELYLQVRTLLKAQEELQSSSTSNESSLATPSGSKKRPRPPSRGPPTMNLATSSSASTAQTQSIQAQSIQAQSIQVQSIQVQQANHLASVQNKVNATLQNPHFKPRVNLISLPLPRDTPEFKAISYDAFCKLAKKSNDRPLYDEDDYIAASMRYDETNRNLNILFSSTTEGEEIVDKSIEAVSKFIAQNSKGALRSVLERIETEKQDLLELKSRIESGYMRATESIREFAGMFQGLLKAESRSEIAVADERFSQMHGNYWKYSIPGTIRKRTRQEVDRLQQQQDPISPSPPSSSSSSESPVKKLKLLQL